MDRRLSVEETLFDISMHAPLCTIVIAPQLYNRAPPSCVRRPGLAVTAIYNSLPHVVTPMPPPQHADAVVVLDNTALEPPYYNPRVTPIM